MLVASKTPSDQKSYKSNKVVLYNGNKSLHLLYGIITWFIGKVNFCSVAAGAPNITGRVFASRSGGSWGFWSNNLGAVSYGAFYNDPNYGWSQSIQVGAAYSSSPSYFSASRSSGIYGAATTVRPLSRRTVFLIRY